MNVMTRTDEPRTHFILVPGFAGFDALGSLHYYHGVTEVLRGWKGAMYEAPLTLHYFPNLPTARIETRAKLLLDWLLQRYKRGLLRLDRGDAIHFIGHSTGGMDIRWMMKYLHEHAVRSEPIEKFPAEAIIKSICSVQFLSTPHRGSNLAHVVGGWSGKLQALVTVLYEASRTLRQPGARLLASSLKRLGWSAGWVHAILDTMTLFSACDEQDGLARARARGVYFDTLKWLNDASDDFGAVADLDPARYAADAAHAEDLFRTTYAHVRLRSIVTRAEPLPGAPDHDLFKLFHRWTAFEPGQELGPDCSVRRLDAAGSVALDRAHNDGIVNCVSMVWPTPDESVFVDADHADILGHHGGPGAPDEDVVSPAHKRYDIFLSSSGFNRDRFLQVWRSVRSFAFASESSRDRRATLSRVALPAFAARIPDAEADHAAAADSAPAPRAEADAPSPILGAEGAVQ
ncbi:esterase/lipase family protein [Sorangium sp. So ce176]|uniref:esterase/lipase family protein n=1 Tax=Sorangium sp. So ce176 TaxID=3133286 RepID=UPI003F644B62